MVLLHVFALVVICAGLSGLAVGLGAAFPSLKEDSPAKIVSGFGGTLNLVLSLAFMAAVVLLEAIPCHLYYARDLLGWPDFKRTILWCSLGVLGLGLCATFLPMRLGERAFRRMDL
jgi:ABC-2 type transport system permease protein